MSNTPKRGRGRPKGSTSFVKVSLADLNANLGPNAKIPVSKKWLEDFGIEVSEQQAPAMIISAITDEPDAEERIQFEVY